jgi:hypothetical protein
VTEIKRSPSISKGVDNSSREKQEDVDDAHCLKQVPITSAHEEETESKV